MERLASSLFLGGSAQLDGCSTSTTIFVPTSLRYDYVSSTEVFHWQRVEFRRKSALSFNQPSS